MQKVDIYASADRQVQVLNREIIREFGKLKTSKLDELHIIRAVTGVYRELERSARKRYRKIAMDSFEVGLILCGFGLDEARKKASKAIGAKWVDNLLKEVDPVLGYRFGTETERKAQRLAEMLEAAAERSQGRLGSGETAADGRIAEIDRAAKLWSRQVNDFAVEVTDAALMEAYEEGGEPEVMWLSERDNRVCTECHALDGRTFTLREVPYKPHRNCRCKVVPFGRQTMVV